MTKPMAAPADESAIDDVHRNRERLSRNTVQFSITMERWNFLVGCGK